MSEQQACMCQPGPWCPSCYTTAWCAWQRGTQNLVSETHESHTMGSQSVYSFQSDQSRQSDQSFSNIYRVSGGQQDILRAQGSHLLPADEHMYHNINRPVKNYSHINLLDQSTSGPPLEMAAEASASAERIELGSSDFTTVSTSKDSYDAILTYRDHTHDAFIDESGHLSCVISWSQQEHVGKVAIPRQVQSERCARERVQCDIHPCKQTFAKSADLKRHVDTVHKQDKAYHCKPCHYSTNRQDKMKEHCQRKRHRAKELGKQRFA